jgi:hypothetical protein
LRIIIAGSRNFNDFNVLDREVLSIIKELHDKGYSTKREKVIIVSGNARGADKLGEEFARRYNLSIASYPANWDLYGKSAGYRRNEEMAIYAKQDKEVGVLIAFWDGISKGTKHMIDLANKHGLKVYIVKF